MRGGRWLMFDVELRFLVGGRAVGLDGFLDAVVERISRAVRAEMPKEMQSLSKVRQAVVEQPRHEIEGYSFKEIAAQTGVSVNTLLSRKPYAVLHQRQRLQAIYDEFVRR